MWCLVEFDGPKPSYAVVHKCWLIGNNKCFWPSFWRNNKKLEVSLRNGDLPNSQTWKVYEVHVIGNRFFGTYDEARIKLALPTTAEDSDLSTSEDTGRLRKRHLNDAIDDSSDEGENSQTTRKAEPKQNSKKTRQLFKLPSPPHPPSITAMPRSSDPNPCLIAVGNISNDCSQSALMQDKISGLSSPAPTSETIPQSPCNSFSQSGPSRELTYVPIQTPDAGSYSPSEHGRSLYEQNQTPHFSGYGHQSFQQEFNHNQEGELNLLVKGLQTQVNAMQSQQTVIVAKQDVIIDMLQTLLQSRARKPINDVPGKLRLPLQTADEVRQLDSDIKQDRELRHELETLLSSRGGSNANQITHRVMTALMTDEAMLSFSMAGQKEGKDKFRDTIILNCICSAVRSQPKGSVATDKEIEAAVEYWLKKTSTRIANKNRTAEKNNNAVNRQSSESN